MIKLRGITTCVNYSDLLRITLPRNMRHFAECLVITSPEDTATIELCRLIPDVQVHVTDAFTRHGARFNKGLAMEEGFDRMGREGWILIWDADCLLADRFPTGELKDGYLHGARRRICFHPDQFTPGMSWMHFRQVRDGGPVGFFQCFQAEDPAIRHRKPWYDVSFSHAGGGDAYFITLWPAFRHTVLNMDVLHLGQPDINWFGTSEESRQIMRAYRARYGWRLGELRNDPVDEYNASMVGEIVERVNVPGYEPSAYELPFTIRAKQLEEERKRRSVIQPTFHRR